MIFIFEDKFEIKEQSLLVGYVGISYLLQIAYYNTEVQLIFAESNRLLKNKLTEAINKRNNNEKIVVYMDLVADNKSTWGIYQKLVQVILQNNYKLVYVLPIPSIEYAFIRSISYICEDKDILQIMIDRELYRTENIFIHSKYNKEGKRSFEKFTKIILEKKFRLDIANNRLRINELNFYNTTTNELGEDISVIKKSWMLWGELPILIKLRSNTYFKTENVDIINVMQDLVKTFLIQVKLYINEGYITSSNLAQFSNDYERYLIYLTAG